MAEWKEYELNQICSRLSSGKGLSAKKILNNGVYPVYGAMDLEDIQKQLILRVIVQ